MLSCMTALFVCQIIKDCKCKYYFNNINLSLSISDVIDKIVKNSPNIMEIECNENNDIPFMHPSHPYIL